ncbi:MAG: folylpolyglutamate synthase/dihydrofolate synthase family protein [Hyphomicrobiales bacterium]
MTEPSGVILERLLSLHPKKIDLSLGRIERLLAALGHPEQRLAPVVHVAGTNGKGSTVAFLRAMLEAAGLGAHVYTSPHLVHFHERIRLAGPGRPGRLVDDATLSAALARCEEVNGGEPITFFEITTAAAFDLFAARPADYVLLEVGLGGRLDATNMVDRPAVSVITSVSHDHAAFLGDTLSGIAREKAGILKAGVAAVIGRQDDEAMSVIEREAARRGAPLVIWGEDFMAHEERGRMVYQDERGLLDLPMPRLAGRHQIENAALAIAALREIADPRVGDAAIETGLQTVSWPGRLQRLTSGRLAGIAPAGAELWLDGGHNPDGGRAIAAAMAELEERVPRPLVVVVGMLTSKAADGFLTNFDSLATRLYTVPIKDADAAFPPGDLADIARAGGLDAVPMPGVAEALAAIAVENWGAMPPRILICGSLYLAGEVLAENGTPPE